MKNFKLLFPVFAIIAILAAAFAFKPKPVAYINANVYCNSTCTSLVDFTPDPIFGTFTVVCGRNNGYDVQEYQLLGDPPICQPIALGQKYDQSIY